MPVGGDHRRHGRRKPYTEIGIARLPCFRCGGRPSVHQWNVCADGLQRPICRDCDAALNELVMRWMGDPDVEAKIARYRERVESER
jgi:transposase-like protein